MRRARRRKLCRPGLGARSRSGRLGAGAPGRCALAGLLLLTAGVTEAFGLLMIVPLLQVAALVDVGGGSIPVVETATRVARPLGAPLTLPGVLAMFLVLAAIRSIAPPGAAAC